MTNITFRNCVCVLGSTIIIWCSQRFLCALELICLFTKICSHSQPEKKNENKKYITSAIMICVQHLHLVDGLVFFPHFVMIYRLYLLARQFKMWTKKRETSDRMLGEDQTSCIQTRWWWWWYECLSDGILHFIKILLHNKHTNHFLACSIAISSMYNVHMCVCSLFRSSRLSRLSSCDHSHSFQ